MVVRGKVERPLPPVALDIQHETYLKILGVYFNSEPTNWDQQFDSLLSKAGKRMCILRVCKKYLPTLSFQ